jgi:hypothetical protein
VRHVLMLLRGHSAKLAVGRGRTRRIRLMNSGSFDPPLVRPSVGGAFGGRHGGWSGR